MRILPIGFNSLHIGEEMDRLKELSRKFLNGELDHTIFQREVVDLFKSERFFKDELREFAQAILTQAILKGRMEP